MFSWREYLRELPDCPDLSRSFALLEIPALPYAAARSRALGTNAR
jgi:hypothetical protein